MRFLERHWLDAVAVGAEVELVAEGEEDGEEPTLPTPPGSDVEDAGVEADGAAGTDGLEVGVGLAEEEREDELEPELPEEEPEPLIVATSPPGKTYVYPAV